jgi:hypothetical protein
VEGQSEFSCSLPAPARRTARPWPSIDDSGWHLCTMRMCWGSTTAGVTRCRSINVVQQQFLAACITQLLHWSHISYVYRSGPLIVPQDGGYTSSNPLIQRDIPLLVGH